MLNQISPAVFSRSVAFLALFFSVLICKSAAQEGAFPHVALLTIDGAIGPATTDYFKRATEEAGERGAELIILHIDTPGGLDAASRDIIQHILSSPIPIATYVYPSGARAASAGTYILYASQIAAMAPATTLGAATPVQIGGPPGTPTPGGKPQENEKKRKKKRKKVTRKAKRKKRRSLYPVLRWNVRWLMIRSHLSGGSLSAMGAMRIGQKRRCAKRQL
ncbi:hypothetical protein P3339_18375 [Microbulbifer sp. MLAF003]|uniref:hypothetical protein n=1 Tax=Microbulbifer sp. MLAF003 TaxID=3032582 RepID=UPI0024AD5E32|nr:hypothetical protein [Microbulbifer sp. MLAF003]WHI50390.1 hypothetical protein P3339_18375 [Microbulbifer sp. MLAF003]